MSDKVRIDGHNCSGCYNYRHRKVFIPYVNPFVVYYCNALSDCQYGDVEHYQGHGRISIHYPIVYNPDKRLPECPLNRDD